MPDLDFPDLVNPAADAATPPPFDTLRARAETRQKRRASATALAVVVAIVAVASGIAIGSANHNASLPPATPTQTTTPAPQLTWRQMDDQQRLTWVTSGGYLAGFAVDEQGNSIVLWNRVEKSTDELHSAWELLDVKTGKHVSELAPGRAYGVTPVKAGFLINQSLGGPSPFLVRPDASTEALTQAPSIDNLADAVELSGPSYSVVVDPATSTWTKLTLTHEMDTAGVIAGSGIWVWDRSGGHNPVAESLHRLCPPGWPCPSNYAWSPVSFVGSTAPGLLASSGRRVAAFGSMDGVDVATVHQWAVSDDGGDHFRLHPGRAVPFTSVLSMAATGTGTLVVVDGEGKLWSSQDWLHFTPVSFGAAPVPDGTRIWNVEPGPNGDLMAKVMTAQQPTIVMLDSQTLRAAEWMSPERWRDAGN